MKITGGTIKGLALLEELQQQGDLVDVYSKAFFDRQPSIKKDPHAPLSCEGFEFFLKEYENDPENDYKPLGHLLFVHVDGYKEDLRKSLVKVYEPLAKLIDSGDHNPDFLLINLFTQQVLCVGFGRKNRLFVIDAATNENVNAFGLLSGLHWSGLMAGEDHGYMDRFTKHDVYGYVRDFVSALSGLGVAMFRYDSMTAPEYQIEYTLDSGPNEHGVYQLKDLDNTIINDEEFSKERMDDMLKEAIEYQHEETKSMQMIKVFFPQCERGELNTGDY